MALRSLSRVGVVVACMALLAACAKSGGADGAAKKQRPPPLVVASKIVAHDVAVEVNAPVDLRPLEQVDVGSKTLGYVDAVLVDRGDHVKKGQLIALVRPSDLPDQLTAARSSVVQAEASLALAVQNRDRAQALAPSGVVSQQELQQAQAAVATAEAAAATGRAQIGALGVRLGETRIEAPIAGVVVSRKLDPGALVGPQASAAILTIARVDRLRVFIAAGERDATRITLGKAAHIELDGVPGRSFLGSVARLSPSFDPGTRTLEAEVQLENADGLLRPGMYGRGAIVLEVHPRAPIVPASAVQLTAGASYVFVLDGKGEVAKVSRRKIETGVDEGSWLEVLGGLSIGDEVVTAGADGLADGAPVRVARDVDPFSGRKLAAGDKP